ncbi:MAG: cobyric acid synthase [Desulfatitalea sp.]|nr:cobyric acid synthase [Desulfatitalea sp.]
MKSDQKKNKAPCIAILGTGSDVGKSVIATALCRIFAQQGVRVAPFKAQNMSNNSGVTPEGLEMGRAQIVQAEAARIAPHVDMNPILLKPTSDVGAQVVVLGRSGANAEAKAYHRQKEALFGQACAALDRLRADFDLIVMEGAGSCAEVNLMANDIVNLSMAAHARAPVILVADIHRGGVFAQVVGTLACLAPDQRQQIKGVIINRFRGDIDLFKDGVAWIEAHTRLPVFGVLPWYSSFKIEDEDSVVIEQPAANLPADGRPALAVVRLPHISNFTDFDPLMQLDGVQVCYLERPRDLERFRAVILPGSKNTRGDLEWLSAQGWREAVARYVAQGGHVLGICGGYQMLGRAVHDPHGVEARPGTTPGLDLLPVETELKAPKTTTRTRFSWNGTDGEGYEIHMGQTRRTAGAPLLRVQARNGSPCDDEDGCASRDGHVLGTYIHGLFDAPGIIRLWLARIGLAGATLAQAHGPAARDRAYDALAAHTRKYLDVTAIGKLAQAKQDEGMGEQ